MFKLTGKLSSLVMVLLVFLALAAPAWAAARHITFALGENTYVVDSQEYYMDAYPFTKNDRTLVPVRYLAMSLGVLENDILWNGSTGEVSLSLNNTLVKMWIGSTTLSVNGRTQQMDVAPIIREGRTYLPARYLAEAFGYNVDWDAQTRTVIINSSEDTQENNAPIPEPDIAQYIPSNAYSDIRRISLTGNEPSEAVAVYYTSEPDYSTNAGVIVEKYNSGSNSWEIVFERQYEGYHLQIIDSGKLLGDEREQVAIGSWEGSGGYLNFFLLGSTGDQVAVLLDEMEYGYFQGGLKIMDGDLLVSAASQGSRFHWNGSYFEESLYLNNPEVNNAKPGDIIINYSIDQDDNISATYPNGSTLPLKVGQSIYLVRDNEGVTERILFSGNILNSQEDGGIKAIMPGEGEINIIPEGYNWEKAMNYNVNVSQ